MKRQLAVLILCCAGIVLGQSLGTGGISNASGGGLPAGGSSGQTIVNTGPGAGAWSQNIVLGNGFITLGGTAFGAVINFQGSSSGTSTISVASNTGGNHTLQAQTGTLTDTLFSGTLSVTAGNAVGCVDQTTTVTGATTSQKVIISPISPQANTDWSGYISSANTLDIHVCTLVALTGSAVTYNYAVVN